jgi:4-alpha-glucanotransferase
VQWLAEEQLAACAKAMCERGQSLYLDLPLGVNAASYDVWRERGAFALGASGGCPPDAVFPNGQNWGFPPLHPAGIREQGYQYLRESLRHLMRHAGMLRIDHIPVFHRLYWVPEGFSARDGAYVRYPAAELYAIFSLESHRQQTLLVGEDLGTVPPEVPAAMREHQVLSMHVTQYAARPDPQAALPAAPALSVASLNTHDMPPFAAFVEARDVEEREQLGLLGELDPDKEREKRQAVVAALRRFFKLQDVAQPTQSAELLAACLRQLAGSEARVVLLNVEDLWLAKAAQNMPGTAIEHPNWRRKMEFPLEDWAKQPLSPLLEEVRALRATDQRESCAPEGA